MQATTHHPSDPQFWNGKYGNYLLKVASSKIKDPEQARDLVQDTFLAALERLNYFKGISTERTWLTGILLYKIIDLYRKKGLQQRKEAEIIDMQIYRQSDFSIDEKLFQKEFIILLHHNLAKMPGVWAEVFKMKYLDELSASQICAQLQLTPGNLWTITHRGKNQLRSFFQKSEPALF